MVPEDQRKKIGISASHALSKVHFCTEEAARASLSGAREPASLAADTAAGRSRMRCPATLLLSVLFMGSAWAREDKKTDDLKSADRDTGKSIQVPSRRPPPSVAARLAQKAPKSREAVIQNASVTVAFRAASASASI